MSGRLFTARGRVRSTTPCDRYTEFVEHDPTHLDAWRVDDPVRVYLAEVAKVAPLGAAEEMKCIEHVRAGDTMAESATVRLVEAHLALVVSIAERYQNSRVYILDLIQAGNSSLLGALEALKHGTQQTFAGLATEHIERGIQKALAAPE